MKINWQRVLRTLVQTASGAGVALITAISADYSKGSIITALVGFGTSTLIAVLMNINKQAEEQIDEHGDE